MAEKTGSTNATGNVPAQTVAPKTAAVAPGNIPAGIPAASSVPAYGGNRGGRPRKDGLPPGSQQADEADRKKNREDKRAAREQASKVAVPAPLPSAVAPGPGPVAPSSPALPGATPGAVPSAEAPPVPWQPETLTGLVDDLIEAAEENRVGNYLGKCAEAGLTPKLTKEIENDARFPKTAKALLKSSIPRLAAKWLNRSGISAEYQDEIAVLTAIILIVKHDASANTRLDELIVEFKKTKAPAPAAAPAKTPPLVPALPKVSHTETVEVKLP